MNRCLKSTYFENKDWSCLQTKYSLTKIFFEKVLMIEESSFLEINQYRSSIWY